MENRHQRWSRAARLLIALNRGEMPDVFFHERAKPIENFTPFACGIRGPRSFECFRRSRGRVLDITRIAPWNWRPGQSGKEILRFKVVAGEWFKPFTVNKRPVVEHGNDLIFCEL
jgi:hypothetical protein